MLSYLSCRSMHFASDDTLLSTISTCHSFCLDKSVVGDELNYFHKKVATDLVDALAVKFPLGNNSMMVDGPFDVPWAGVRIEKLVSLATAGKIELGSERAKTSIQSSRLKHANEGIDATAVVFVAVGVKKEQMLVQVTGHELQVAAPSMTPDGPKPLGGTVGIEKEILYDAKRVTWDLTDGYLRVTFPFGSENTMVQGPFAVTWAPYQDPTTEKTTEADGAGSSSGVGAEQMKEQKAANDHGGHEKKLEEDDGKENANGSEN